MSNSKTSRYNISNTTGVPTESEPDMSYNPLLQELHEDSKPTNSDDPILERTSDVYGWVRVFPPTATDKAEWAKLPWLLLTQKGPDAKPVEAELKAWAVMECFERPHFISSYHMFGNPDPAKVEAKEPEKWNIEIPDRKVEHKDFRFDD